MSSVIVDTPEWVDVGSQPAECLMDCQPDLCVRHHTAAKTELHRVLNSFQHSQDFGLYVCEAFRDPRQHYIDDYWAEVQTEAVGISELRKIIGKTQAPLSDDARCRLYQFARLLERLSKRLDRVVTAP